MHIQFSMEVSIEPRPKRVNVLLVVRHYIHVALYIYSNKFWPHKMYDGGRPSDTNLYFDLETLKC
jgi:hypothetical protein